MENLINNLLFNIAEILTKKSSDDKKASTIIILLNYTTIYENLLFNLTTT